MKKTAELSSHPEFDHDRYWRFERVYRPGLTQKTSHHEDVMVLIVAVLCAVVGYIVVSI